MSGLPGYGCAVPYDLCITAHVRENKPEPALPFLIRISHGLYKNPGDHTAGLYPGRKQPSLEDEILVILRLRPTIHVTPTAGTPVPGAPMVSVDLGPLGRFQRWPLAARKRDLS
jgi:hypothetical protein